MRTFNLHNQKPIMKLANRIEIYTQPEEIPVRGNALASGDDAEDRAIEDSILSRLEAGDEWAWCMVTVRVTLPCGRFAEDHLGCCSYDDERDFRAGGYFEDMVSNCMEALA
jgi:hypothetical protein